MSTSIATIILAAGESRRMGQPKLLLPWGQTTVLSSVVQAFATGMAGFPDDQNEIWIVTGGANLQVEALVATISLPFPLRTVFNPIYSHGGMISSLQTGLKALPKEIGAALIGLGDQPQIRPENVHSICSAWLENNTPMVIPTFNERRGHPWLVRRDLWPEILELPLSATAREFLNSHPEEAHYLPLDESILQDVDTPEDYTRLKP